MLGDRVRLVQGLFVLKAVLWVALAAGYFLTQNTTVTPGVLAVVGGLLLMDAALYLFFGWLIGRRKDWITALALLFIAFNAVLTVTDEFGLLDLLVLVIDGVIVGLIVAHWRTFFPSVSAARGG